MVQVRQRVEAEAQGLYNADADVTFDQFVALFTRALVSGEWPERKAA